MTREGYLLIQMLTAYPLFAMNRIKKEGHSINIPDILHYIMYETVYKGPRNCTAVARSGHLFFYRHVKVFGLHIKFQPNFRISNWFTRTMVDSIWTGDSQHEVWTETIKPWFPFHHWHCQYATEILLQFWFTWYRVVVSHHPHKNISIPYLKTWYYLIPMAKMQPAECSWNDAILINKSDSIEKVKMN